MPLGTQVGLVPGHIVLDGVPAPLSKKGAEPRPNFRPFLWPNGWMDEDSTWYGSRPRPRPHCTRLVPSYPRKGHSSPRFRPTGRPYQLLLSSCCVFPTNALVHHGQLSNSQTHTIEHLLLNSSLFKRLNVPQIISFKCTLARIKDTY